MIAFRVDVNAQIGTGHFMRCLAIAQELLKLGEDAVFITADDAPAPTIKQAGLNHYILNTDWMRMDTETQALLIALKELKVDLLVIDSYYVTAEYFLRIKDYVTTAYIDDFAKQAYPVDVLINYNISCDTSAYKRVYHGNSTKLLLGTEYTPLREEFGLITPPPIRDRISQILIMTGGTDPWGITFFLARRLLPETSCNDVKIYIIVGKYFTNTTQLRELAQQFANVKLCENVTSMSEWMIRSDVAISASGTSLYELCACGVPAVIFSFVDNQTRIRECFGESGAMIDCGDFRNQKELCFNKILAALKMLEGAEKRNELREKLLSITDGKGAFRLATQLSDRAKGNRSYNNKD